MTPPEKRLPWHVRYAPWTSAIVGAVSAAAVLAMGFLAGDQKDRADTEADRADVAEVQADKGLDLAEQVASRCRVGGQAARELGDLCSKARDVQDAPQVPARDGVDGVGIARVDTGRCSLTVLLTDGRSDTLTNLCGEPGKTPPPGRGITSAEQDGCFVTLTYTDGFAQRLGSFCGLAGPQGEKGDKGEPGVSPPCLSEPAQCRGPIGPRGEDGNPAQSQTFALPDGRRFACVRDDGSPDTAPTYTCTQTQDAAGPGGLLPEGS